MSGLARLFSSAIGRIKNKKIKHNILQAIPFWAASLITGFVAVLYAKLFALAEHLIFQLFESHAWAIFVVAPVGFVTSWWLVERFEPLSKGSGIPQVMAAIDLATPKQSYLIKHLLSVRIVIIKILSSMLLVMSGGAVGREGPTIQISASIFRKINEMLPSWYPKIANKNMIMTGAAAGLAAAFNTPLGGIVFAVEELTKTHISYFKSAIFTAVIIAGLTAQAFAGPYLYLGFPKIEHISYFILFAVVLVASVAGLLGSGMSKVILGVLAWKKRLPSKAYHVGYALFCAMLIACMAYFISGQVLGSGKEIMMQLLFTDQKTLPWYLPILRMISSVFSFTSGGAGGVFAPGLATGASIGSWIAGLLEVSPSHTNVLILTGMVAFLTGITRSPFTSAILVLEMTDRNNLILHLMLAGLVASYVSLIIDKHSFYDHLKHTYLKEVESCS